MLLTLYNIFKVTYLILVFATVCAHWVFVSLTCKIKIIYVLVENYSPNSATFQRSRQQRPAGSASERATDVGGTLSCFQDVVVVALPNATTPLRNSGDSDRPWMTPPTRARSAVWSARIRAWLSENIGVSCYPPSAPSWRDCSSSWYGGSSPSCAAGRRRTSGPTIPNRRSRRPRGRASRNSRVLSWRRPRIGLESWFQGKPLQGESW